MSKKVQTRDAKLSKEKIITNAIRLFSENGYDSTSMEELSKASGLNKAMIFYYYKNKKGLYEAVLSEVLRQIQETVVRQNSKASTPREEMESFIRTYAHFACNHPYLPSLLLKELSGGSILPKMLFGSMRRLFSLFSDILLRGKEKGCFVDTQPMILYFMIIGTLNLLITTKSLRIEASKMDDIAVDTCASCTIDDIADDIVGKIFTILTKEKDNEI